MGDLPRPDHRAARRRARRRLNAGAPGSNAVRSSRTSSVDDPGSGLRFVASDFYGYLKPSRCGLRVWLREQGAEEDPPSELAEMLMRLGIEHERRHLARFPRHLDIAGLPREEQRRATIDAVRAGGRVIYQGRLEATTVLGGREVGVVGLPDFMLPARRGYAIRDSKLNRRVGPYQEHVRLQLEIYGWLYERTFGEPPVALQVHAGTGEILHIDYEGGTDALATYAEMLDFRLSEDEPDEWVGVSKCGGCGFRSRCWPRAEERLDVGILPWVERGLVAELHRRGAATIPELLERFDVERLGAIELPWREGTRPIGDRAERILLSARARLEGRPIVIKPPEIPAHDTYVMFDLEGMQPSLDELEKIYIWGMQPFGEGAGEFRAGVAGFGRGGDREGWESFLRQAAAIFAEHGDVPFVHWAAYEKAKVNLYVERYGDRDGIARRVLDNLLDLLPITRDAVAVPLSSYGLKEIETLTGYERRLDDFGGEWSMARYIEATETNDRGHRAAIMGEILAYNREDLEATWAVLEWLLGLGEDAASAGHHSIEQGP
ncbi:MAG: TM0106 family RecB-like putative nuclease [Acidobacteria bacterium]|nr:MAG: TM0106 family RecB-like putative nuclease [Acidobacteriota bacterium]